MLLGGVGRAEAQLAGDLCAGGRSAGAFDRALHEIENLLLALGELRLLFGKILHRFSPMMDGWLVEPTTGPRPLAIHPVLYFHPGSSKMQSSPESSAARVVVLGTGGTIAGTSASADDNVGYTAAQRGVAQLVAAVPALKQLPIETEQVAQLDSK